MASLFDVKGNLLRRIDLPLRAAELMLEEEPGHVIFPAENLRRTGRFSGAAKADEELVSGESYFLVPLSKLNRKAYDDIMAALDHNSTSKKKKKTSSSRVSPAMAEEYDSKEEKEKEDVIRVFEDISVGVSTDLGFLCRPRGYCRGWRPALETIIESRF